MVTTPELLSLAPEVLALSVPPCEALALAPEGERAADARFRLIAGPFYDSFALDPLRPLDPDWQRLSGDIAAAEAFLHQHHDQAPREQAAAEGDGAAADAPAEGESAAGPPPAEPAPPPPEEVEVDPRPCWPVAVGVPPMVP